MTQHSTPGVDRRSRIGRRRFLAAGLGAGAGALAGCSNVVDFFGNLALEDLNLFNGTDRELPGRTVVTDPSGETVHDQEFTLAPANADGGSEDETNFEPYESVLTGTGEYTVRIELADGASVRGATEIERSLPVDPDNGEKILVFLAPEDTDKPAVIEAVDGISDVEGFEETPS